MYQKTDVTTKLNNAKLIINRLFVVKYCVRLILEGCWGSDLALKVICASIWDELPKRATTGNIILKKNFFILNLTIVSFRFSRRRKPHDRMSTSCNARLGSVIDRKRYHRALSPWGNEPVNNKVTNGLPTSRTLSNSFCFMVAIYNICVMRYDSCENIVIMSHHGGCWWPGAYLAPGHVQPSWRRNPVGVYKEFPT